MCRSNSDNSPSFRVVPFADECWRGWPDIVAVVNSRIDGRSEADRPYVVAVECHSGVHEKEIAGRLLEGVRCNHFLTTHAVFKSPQEIDDLLAPYLGIGGSISGHMCPLSLDIFLDPFRCEHARQEIARMGGITIVFGMGASLICKPDLTIYADASQEEDPPRQPHDVISDRGINNREVKVLLQYSRFFGIDRRVLDLSKALSMPQWDYVLDTTIAGNPRMVSGRAMRAAAR